MVDLNRQVQFFDLIYLIEQVVLLEEAHEVEKVHHTIDHESAHLLEVKLVLQAMMTEVVL